jgi:hypothetical protein
VTVNYTRRRPSRRLTWLLAIVTVVVIGFVLATTLRSERRILAQYLDTAQRSAALAASAATEFDGLVAGLENSDRGTFTSSMRGIRERAAEAFGLLDVAEVPGSAVAAHARLSAATSSWIEGLDVFQGGVLDAADRPADPVPAGLLRTSIIDLAVGDAAYEAAVIELMAVEAEADVEFTDYPTVAFVAPDVGWESVATSARSADDLALRIDVAVTALGLEPRILRHEDDGTGVLPFTERLIVGATVINQGNEPLTDIGVEVLLLASRFGAAASEANSIERLEAGESTSLEYVFTVSTSVDYELVVQASGATGERNLANNRVVQPFYVNDEE